MRVWSDTILMHKEEMQTLKAKRDTLLAPIRATQQAIYRHEEKALPATGRAEEEQEEAAEMVRIYQAELATLLGELTKHANERARRERVTEQLQLQLDEIDPNSLASESSREEPDEDDEQWQKPPSSTEEEGTNGMIASRRRRTTNSERNVMP